MAPVHFARAVLARRYARGRGLDMSFADFGQRLGWRLLLERPRDAMELLLVPVHDIRYWEYGFVWPRITGSRLLDVGSPRLLTLRLASLPDQRQIEMINPDRRDTEATEAAARRLGLSNLQVRTIAIADLAEGEGFDSVWSISVVEHIEDDTAAVARLWSATRTGGRLILTVPVDRTHWDEYRSTDVYELSSPVDGELFFQRFYTQATIESRLLTALTGADIELAWWGETSPGSFQGHIARWQRWGFDEIVNDPRHIVDGYRAFGSWASMPGFGVCGIAATKRQGAS